MSKIKVTDIDATGIDDAKYLRGDGSWNTPPGGGIPDAPSDGNYYARKDAEWASFVPGGGGGGGSVDVQQNGSTIVAAASVLNFTGGGVSVTDGGGGEAIVDISGGGGGGGGGGGALVRIAQIVTTGSQSEVVFSGFPSTYDDLIVVMTARSDKSGASFDDLRMQLNGDTGGNYDSQAAESNGSGIFGVANSGATELNIGWLPATTAPANTSNNCEILIPHYSRTGFEKTILGRTSLKLSNSTSGTFSRTGGGWWRDPDPVTSIRLYPLTSNFADGSVITLYGRGGSGAGTAGGMTLIGEFTAVGGETQFSFIGIPDNYKALRLLTYARSDAPANDVGLSVNFNADTSGAYDWRQLFNGSVPVGSDSANLARIAQVAGAFGTSGVFDGGVHDFPDYSSSIGSKSCVWSCSNSEGGNYRALTGNFRWRNSAPINRIDVGMTSGAFVAGSRVALYGY